MATRAPIFHLTPEAGRRPKLEIIGVAHAGPYTPADRPDRRYLKNFLKDYQGRVFVEGGIGDIFPRKYAWMGKPIEPPLVRKIAEDALARDIAKSVPEERAKKGRRLLRLAAAGGSNASALARLAAADWKRYLKNFWKKEVQTKPRTRAEERADTKGASKLFGAATSQIVTIRSLFMASEFLRHSREQHAPMVLVTGAGHASQLHRFIENPRMALNYIRLIRGPLQKLPDLNQLERNDLDKLLKTAEDEFTELLREKQKPASPQQRKP